MSKISENHHAISALDWSGAEMAERQVHATLALAYEQRTANLIAITSVFREAHVKGQLHSAAVQELVRLAEEVNNRLGIEA